MNPQSTKQLNFQSFELQEVIENYLDHNVYRVTLRPFHFD